MALIKNTLSKLKILYDQSQGAKEINLFRRKLFDFVKEYDINPCLKPVLQSIVDKANQDKKELFGLHHDGLSEINSAQKEVETYTTDQGLDMICFTEKFHSYDLEKFSKKDLADQEILVYKMEVFGNELAYLSELGITHHFFILKFVEEIPPSKTDLKDFIDLKLKLHSCLAYLEKRDIQNFSNKNKIYYNWDIIAWIYNLSDNYEEIMKDFQNGGKILSIPRLEDMYLWLNNPFKAKKIFDDKFNDDYNLEFLKDSLQKVYFYTEQILSFPEQEKDEFNKPENKIFYSYEEGRLFIGEYIIEISKKRFAHKILPIIDKFINKYKKNDWTWDQVFEEDQCHEPVKKNKKYQRKLYDEYRYINCECLKQSKGSIKKFLKFGMKKAGVDFASLKKLSSSL
jgi:hypothetical protein